MYVSYKNMLEQGTEQVKLDIPENEEEYRGAIQVEFDTAQMCEKYRKKVLQDAAECKYPENERYFAEITAYIN